MYKAFQFLFLREGEKINKQIVLLQYREEKKKNRETQFDAETLRVRESAISQG